MHPTGANPVITLILREVDVQLHTLNCINLTMEEAKATLSARARREQVRRHLQKKAHQRQLRQPDVLLPLIRHIL